VGWGVITIKTRRVYLTKLAFILMKQILKIFQDLPNRLRDTYLIMHTFLVRVSNIQMKRCKRRMNSCLNVA